MTNDTITITFPGVLAGIVQERYCRIDRGSLSFKSFEKGHYAQATQMIAVCNRCHAEQSIEGEAHLHRR